MSADPGYSPVEVLFFADDQANEAILLYELTCQANSERARELTHQEGQDIPAPDQHEDIARYDAHSCKGKPYAAMFGPVQSIKHKQRASGPHIERETGYYYVSTGECDADDALEIQQEEVPGTPSVLRRSR